MGMVKTFVVAVCCGVVLLSAVSAHAGFAINGLTMNGLSNNGLNLNGLHVNGWANGLSVNGLLTHEAAPVAGPREGLPFSVISQRALGNTHP
jgi:hypothetical protein